MAEPPPAPVLAAGPWPVPSLTVRLPWLASPSVCRGVSVTGLPGTSPQEAGCSARPAGSRLTRSPHRPLPLLGVRNEPRNMGSGVCPVGPGHLFWKRPPTEAGGRLHTHGRRVPVPCLTEVNVHVPTPQAWDQGHFLSLLLRTSAAGVAASLGWRAPLLRVSLPLGSGPDPPQHPPGVACGSSGQCLGGSAGQSRAAGAGP